MKHSRKFWIAALLPAFVIAAVLIMPSTVIYAEENEGKTGEPGYAAEAPEGGHSSADTAVAPSDEGSWEWGDTRQGSGLLPAEADKNVRFSGSYHTADAYDQFELGQSVQMWGLTNSFGYGERQYIYALKNCDNSLLDSWNEGVMGTQDGIPYFCIEADIDYDNSVLAGVYDGLSYMSQEEITECALACRYMEEHIGEINNNKTDLFFLQQCAVWTIRENYGYRAYSTQSNYVAPYTASHNGDINFAYAFVQNSISWAAANRDNYMGYCKVLDNHAGQKCGVFKAVEKPGGVLNIQKSSSQPQISGGNSCYTLENAEYTVYRSGTDEIAGIIVTNADGYGKLEHLEAGCYEILETKAPEGYLRDLSRHTVIIYENAAALFSAADLPGQDPVSVLLEKRDTETGTAQGGATLEGAEYTVRYYDTYSETDPAEAGMIPKYTWVFRTDVSGKVMMDETHKVSGDGLLAGSTAGIAVLPLGTLTIQETKAPSGYLLNDRVYVANTVLNSGSAVTSGLPNCEEYKAEDQVIRGDLEFVKLNADNEAVMAGIEFRITSGSTGESHTVVSDGQGSVSTSAAARLRNQNTGREQAGSDGVWFGAAAPDATKGALIYDTYRVEELPCEKNYGKDLAEFEITVTENGAIVNAGEIRNRTILTDTEASAGPSGAKTVTDVENAQIRDVFRYKNLTAGREYTLKGYVRNPDTGRIIEQGGKPLTVEKNFTPSGEQGEVELMFSLDAVALEGEKVVITEELYRGEIELTRHEELHDPDQTISVLIGDLTVTKSIAADEIHWEHGNPVFLIRVTGITEGGNTCTFTHLFCFERDFVEKNTTDAGEVSLSHTFQGIPVSRSYRVEEVKVSRYCLGSVTGNGSHVQIIKNSGEGSCYAAGAEVNLAAEPNGTEVVFKNKKTNDGWLGHSSWVRNVILSGIP